MVRWPPTHAARTLNPARDYSALPSYLISTHHHPALNLDLSFAAVGEADGDGWVEVHAEGTPTRRGLVPAAYIRNDSE